MARWVAIFEDNEAMPEVRRQSEADHFAFLDANRDRILIAGGLRPVPGGSFVGGLWVLEVADRNEAVSLIEQDPYHRLGQRKYQLLAWGKALDGPVTL